MTAELNNGRVRGMMMVGRAVSPIFALRLITTFRNPKSTSTSATYNRRTATRAMPSKIPRQ